MGCDDACNAGKMNLCPCDGVMIDIYRVSDDSDGGRVMVTSGTVCEMMSGDRERRIFGVVL